MKRIKFGNTGLPVSEVAMGGIPIMRLDTTDAVKVIRDVIDMGVNFIDTANAYGDSEEKIGEALKKYRREDIILSSKSGARDKKTFSEHVNLSLKRLNTDYIDIYHLHDISTEEDFDKVMASGGAFHGLEDAIAKGRVRHYAFSSHSIEVAERILNTKKFQVAQIPLNFIDTEAEKLIPLVKKLNTGFIAMKPMGGGLLDEAVLAFKYLAKFDGIVPDPGIEKTEEMSQIIKIVDGREPLTGNEKDRIESIRKEMGDSWCHRCGYCQPCPRGIHISGVLITRSMLKRFDYNGVMRFNEKNIRKARECTECRECVERCPYDLDIPELLKDNIELWEQYMEKH